MKMKFLPRLALVLSLSYGQMVAQDASKASAASQVSLDDEETAVLIPVTLYQKKVFFAVDTGSDLTLLDVKYRERLGLPVDGVNVSTAFSDLPMVVYSPPELTVGDQSLRPERVGCLDLNFLQKVVGKTFDGVLGMDLLKHYVVPFDPAKAIFSLSSKVSKSTKKHATAIPLTTGGSQEHFQLQARINNSVPVNLRIDSGNNGFLSLNQADWNRVFPDEKSRVREFLSVGADARPQMSKNARVQTITIGTNVYTNVIAKLLSNPGLSSQLGYGFLKQHVSTLDFSNQVFYLTPSSHFGELDERSMSGLALIRADSKIMVYSVMQDSPAFEAGIRAGQELVSINGNETASLSLKSIRQILRQKAGSQVVIKVRQGDQTEEIKLRLREFI